MRTRLVGMSTLAHDLDLDPTIIIELARLLSIPVHGRTGSTETNLTLAETDAEAVREGHLVDYDAVKNKSEVRVAGVFLQEGEEVGLIDPETGSERMDMLEDERQFDTAEIERNVTSPDSNRKIIEDLKKYALEH